MLLHLRHVFGESSPFWSQHGQGLTLVHCSAQLEDLRDTSLTLELNLRSFGTHPLVNLGCFGGQGKLKLSGKGQGELKLSGNGNECKPLSTGTTRRDAASSVMCTRWRQELLHSFASQLNLSAFYGLGGTRRDCVARVKGVFMVCRVFLCVRHGSS
jgi:hypothetical protein